MGGCYQWIWDVVVFFMNMTLISWIWYISHGSVHCLVVFSAGLETAIPNLPCSGVLPRKKKQLKIHHSRSFTKNQPASKFVNHSNMHLFTNDDFKYDVLSFLSHLAPQVLPVDTHGLRHLRLQKSQVQKFWFHAPGYIRSSKRRGRNHWTLIF